jgi:hypothetical protein
MLEELEDTKFAAMKAQAAFENGKGDPKQSLHDWLCAEITHANQNGIDWITMPDHQVETDQDYEYFKSIAWNLAKLRMGLPATLPKVA